MIGIGASGTLLQLASYGSSKEAYKKALNQKFDKVIEDAEFIQQELGASNPQLVKRSQQSDSVMNILLEDLKNKLKSDTFIASPKQKASLSPKALQKLKRLVPGITADSILNLDLLSLYNELEILKLMADQLKMFESTKHTELKYTIREIADRSGLDPVIVEKTILQGLLKMFGDPEIALNYYEKAFSKEESMVKLEDGSWILEKYTKEQCNRFTFEYSDSSQGKVIKEIYLPQGISLAYAKIVIQKAFGISSSVRIDLYVGNQEIDANTGSIPLLNLINSIGDKSIEVRSVQLIDYNTFKNIYEKIRNKIALSSIEQSLWDKGAREMGGMVNSYLNSRGISTKISSKQQINDIVQKIAETTGKTPHEIYAMARVIGPSMDPLFKHGANVPVKLMPFDAKYKKDDIIVFEGDGEFVIHKVEYRFKSDDGKIYYVTGGLNPDTNQYVDNALVSQDDIIGKADLSRKGTVKIEKQGEIVYIEVFGLPNNFDTNKILSEQKINDDYNSILSSKNINNEQFASTLFNLLLMGYSKFNGKIFTFSELAKELGISEKLLNNWLEKGIPNDRIESIREKIWDLEKNEPNILTLAYDEFIKIECLLDYYNSPFKDYYLSAEKLMEKQLKEPDPLHPKDYPMNWDNPNSIIRNKQRELDLKFTKELNILTGKSLSQQWKNSGPLHHWETTNPGKNKENCQLAATILLDDKTHMSITRRTTGKIRFKNDWQIYHEEKALYCIVSLMKGNIPKCWELDNQKNKIYNEIKNRENIKCILFLLLRHPKIAQAYSDPNFLSHMEAKYSTEILSRNVFNDDDYNTWLLANKPNLGGYL